MTNISIDGRVIRNEGFLVTDTTKLKIISMNILRELGLSGKQVTVEIGNTTVKVRKLETHKRLINVDINIDNNTRRLLEKVFNKY